MKPILLEIKDLSVQYRTDLETVYAVRNLDLSLCPGETLGLVGETGAGKTSTALAVMGLLPKRTGHVESGEVIFDGRDLLKLSEKEMLNIRGVEMSMIFQDPMTALNPVLTVGRQISEAIELHNAKHLSSNEIEQIVDETLTMVGIPPERKKEYPYQFSGGMRQRVVIAMALICDPKLLIADEPTTALDVTIQAQILSMICDLQRKLGTAMILITHDLGVVAETCDKVAVMYAGEVVEYGRLEDIFAGQFHHPYTEGLFRSIPSLTEDSYRLHPIEGLMPNPTDLPAGCCFAPRCRYCQDICRSAKPEVHRDIAGSGIKSETEAPHLIRCHLALDPVRTERRTS